MFLVPMGLIGIVIALLAFGQPLGFVAILGILALFGIIARNAVILIEQIETERAQRPQIWDAVVEATLSRFCPIRADSDLHSGWDYPDCTDGVLGADGFRYYGRPVRRDYPDPHCSARATTSPGFGSSSRRSWTAPIASRLLRPFNELYYNMHLLNNK